MGDIVRRLVWFGVVSSVVAYSIFLIAGSAIHAEAAETARAIVVRDVLKPGSHHLSGMLMVPSTCAELSVRTETISSTTFMLIFKTWEEPSVECVREETPRWFQAIVFAPAVGVSFSGTYDNGPLYLSVLPVLPKPTP